MPVATSTIVIAFAATLVCISVAVVYPSVLTSFFPSCGNSTVCGTYGVATCNQQEGYNCACTTPVWGPGGRDTPCTTCLCQHGGTCVNDICVCPQGTSGDTCEIVANLCLSSPCQNGGNCTSGISAYSCSCPSGFVGSQCQIPNQCASSPCSNGGTCVANVTTGNYTCVCAPGFTGPFCQININECASSPCRNGGVCVDGSNSYTCTCSAGFTGPTCQTSTQPGCGSSPCTNGATCHDGVNSFTCTCAVGFSGVICQTNLNECSSSPCSNNGTCVDGLGSFACICVPGYTGVNCEADIPECSSSPCLNGATCVDGLNRFTCTCMPGFTGPICQTNINDCASAPCANGATCVDGITNYTCTCAAGFTGPRCQSDINECASSPCTNGGTCTNGVNSYTCTCAAGFTGSQCESNVLECSSSPCVNGATCVDGVNSFTCSCAPGFTGTRCQTPVPATPCYNGGTSIPPTTCNCTGTGFAGPQCEFDLGPCGSNVYCAAGQKCQTNVIFNPASLPAYYNSSAPPVLPNQFFPGQCVVNTTGCADNSTSVYSGYGGPGGAQVQVCNVFCVFGGPNPTCQNGGTCTTSGYNSFICTCPAGTTGYACQYLICGSSLCLNNATCFNNTCQCKTGFAGANCEYNAGSCAGLSCSASQLCYTAVSSSGTPSSGSSCYNTPATCSDFLPATYNPVTTTTQTATNPSILVCSQLCQNCNSVGTAYCNSTADAFGQSLTYHCTCNPGYSGTTCSNNTCMGITCQNGGTCSPPGTCTCASPYGGQFCEYSVSAQCYSDACSGSKCYASFSVPGQTNPGSGCSSCNNQVITVTNFAWNITICNDICASSVPCTNGGACLSIGVNNFECDCALGYGGTTCETPPPT